MTCLHCEGWGCSRCEEAPSPGRLFEAPAMWAVISGEAKEERDPTGRLRSLSWPVKLLPGPRVGGSEVYAMRLEALKEAHEIMVEDLQALLRERNEGIMERDRERSCEYGPMYRTDIRRACAQIRAVRLVLGDGRPDRFMLRQVRIRGSFSV